MYIFSLLLNISKNIILPPLQCTNAHKKINYQDLFNDKVDVIINSPEFVQKCKNYNNYIDVELDKEVFKLGFSFESLQKLLKDCKTNSFFKAGHKIYIDTIGTLGEIELRQLMKD